MEDAQRNIKDLLQALFCQAMASRSMENAIDRPIRENEKLHRELLLKRSRLYRPKKWRTRIRRSRGHKRVRSKRRPAHNSSFDRHSWRPARVSRRTYRAQDTSIDNHCRGRITRSGSLLRDACDRSSTTRDPVDVVRDFISETKVDVKAEDLFMQLSILDMFMVARRGRVTGRNRAAVLVKRVEEVRKYHEHRETLHPRTVRDYRRYCAEFYQFEVEGSGPEPI